MKFSPEMNSSVLGVLTGTIWPSQGHYESSLQSSAEATFREIGFQGAVTTEIVALFWEEEGYKVWIDERHSGQEYGEMIKLEERASQAYKNHPEHDIFHSDRRLHEARHKGIQQSMRGSAIGKILSGYHLERYVVFASHPARMNELDVYVVLGVDANTYRRIPAIETRYIDRREVLSSFVDSTAENFLRWAARYLKEDDPGFGAPGIGPAEIARGALDLFVCSLMACAGNEFDHEVVARLNAIAVLPYEGRISVGRMIFSRQEESAVDVAVRLSRPIHLSEIRATRKLIEASGPENALLNDGEVTYGLGKINEAMYHKDREQIFTLTIEDRGFWNIEHAHEKLVVVQDGAPRIPSLPLDQDLLRDVLERVLPGANLEKLVRLASELGKPLHGAMLIISGQAHEEIARLNSQAWAIDPIDLEGSLARCLTSMDGAIIVDIEGRCSGMGVILDGGACALEDPARGSRYNSAVRYIESASPLSVIVVYSTDGSIDVLPKLRPRVRHIDLVAAIREYQDAVDEYISGNSNSRRGTRYRVARARKRINALAFYFSADECGIINDVSDREREWATAGNSSVVVHERRLSPHPALNSTYLIE